MAKFTVTVNSQCKTTPQIEFILGEELLQSCIQDGNTITFETLPNAAPNQCIEGVIRCEEDCESCTQYFKKCICDTVIGVPIDPCLVCKDGFYQEVCTAAQLAKGMSCVNGECKCPSDKPYVHPVTKECVACLDGQTQGCQVCLNGQWVAKDCGQGVCNPATGGCVDCVGGGDCIGANKCCVNNKCVCCPGFVQDPVTGECVPEGECLDDTDCGPCQICNKGACEDACPEGYKCWEGECVPWPCSNTSCENGADCGKDCGCHPTLGCVPCAILECLGLCEETLGCKCNGTVCQPVNNCGGLCATDFDCAEDCMCYNGECVSCENFTEGCPDRVCLDDLRLEKKFSEENNVCELVATLEKNSKCSCPILTAGADVFFNTQARGGAYTYSANVKLKHGMASSRAQFLALQDLGSTGVENDFPVNGMVHLTVSAKFKNALGEVYTITAVNAPIKLSIKDLTEVVFPSATLATTLDTFVSYDAKVEIKGLDFYNNCAYGSNIVMDQAGVKTSTVFSAKKLTSDSDRNPIFNWTRSKGGASTDFRKRYVPKVNGVYTDKLTDPSKLGGELWAGYDYTISVDCSCVDPKTERALFCDIEFVRDVHFKVEDCGRKLTLLQEFEPICPLNRDITQYNSAGFTIPSDAQVFYDLYINDVLWAPFKYVKTGSTWGKLVATHPIFNISKDFNGLVIPVLSGDANITTVTMKQRVADTGIDTGCEVIVPIDQTDAPDPIYNVECLGDASVITLQQNQVQLGLVITVLKNQHGITLTPSGGTYTITGLSRGVEYTFLVEYSSGCQKEFIVTPDCCTSATVTAEFIGQANCIQTVTAPPLNLPVATLPAIIKVLPNGFGTDIVVSYGYNGGNFITLDKGTINGYPDDYVFTSLVERTYDIRVTEGDCVKETIIVVTRCNNTLRVSPTAICSAGTSTLTATGDPLVDFVLATPYGSKTETFDAFGNFTTTVATNGTYEITSINGSAVTGLTASLSVTSSPTLDSITVASTACTGELVTATLVGTPGATAVVNFGDGSDVNINLGGTGTITYDHTYTVAGSYDVTSELIYMGSCSAEIDVSDSIVVSATPLLVLNSSTCAGDNETYSIALTVTPGTATVTSDIGDVTQVGTSVTIDNIDNNETVTVTATNGACESELEVTINCACTPPVVNNYVEGRICEGETSYSTTPKVNIVTSGLFTVEVQQFQDDTYTALTTLTNQSGVVTLPNLSLGAQADTQLLVTVYSASLPGCYTNVQVIPQIDLTPSVTFTPTGIVCNNTSTAVVAHVTPPTGTPAYTYSWVRTSPTDVETIGGSTTNTLVFTPNEIGDWNIELTITYGVGCEEVYNFIMPVYSVDCIWTADLLNPSNDSATTISSSALVSVSDGLVFRLKKRITNDCDGDSPFDTTVDVFKELFRLQLSGGGPITVVNVIKNGVTQAFVPSGPAQNSLSLLTSELNAYVGASVFTLAGTGSNARIRHYINTANVHGFDVNNGYTRSGSPVDYEISTSPDNSAVASQEISFECGAVSKVKTIPDPSVGRDTGFTGGNDIQVDYNSIIINTAYGATMSVDTTNSPLTCSSCDA